MDALWHKVMATYFNTCVYPDCWLPAEVVHEEPPRSLTPRSEETMCPLCNRHHEHIHRVRENALALLEEGKRKVLDFYE